MRLRRWVLLGAMGLVGSGSSIGCHSEPPKNQPVAGHSPPGAQQAPLRSRGVPQTGRSNAQINAECNSGAVHPRGGGTDLLATGVCANAAQRAQYGSPATFRVAIDAVSTRRADGTPVVSEADVSNDLATANVVFSRGGVNLFLNSYAVSDTIPSHIPDNSVGNDAIFQTSSTLAVLYVESYFDGGGVSWSNGTGVIVDRLSRTWDQVLAHEVGHSLGLQHTDYCATNVADGDGVADTPYDPGRGGLACNNGTPTATGATCSSNCSSCPCSGVCTAPLQATKPDVNNIMTKYNDNTCTEYFTDGQYELMRCILRTQQRTRARCPGSRQLCGDPGECVSLRTDENNCGACGNKCRNGQTCSRGSCVSECDPECGPDACVNCCTDCEGNPVCGMSTQQCSHLPQCRPSNPCQ